MKTKIVFLGIFFIAIFLFGCKNAVDEEKYVVWTDSSSYSDFKEELGATIDDGYHKYFEIDNKTFLQMMQNMENEAEYKHERTESQIQKYFLGRGFDSETAEKRAAWLVTVNHGAVFSRNGNVVYVILK